MAKVLTANVLVTRDKKSLQSLFKNDVIDLNSIDRSKFLISPKNNKYLISLEYEVGFNTDSHKFLILNFADIDGKFEIDYFKKETSSLKNMLETAVNSKRSTGVDTIYVSFGCGDKSKDWSSPMSFELYKSDIDIKDGVRYFTLYYLPIDSALFRNQILYDFKETNPKSKYLPIQDSNTVLNVKVDIEYNDSYETILYKLYRVYLEKLCATKNIILLIPDGLSSKINEIAKKQKISPDVAFENTFFVSKNEPLGYLNDVKYQGGNSAGNNTLDVLYEQDDDRFRYLGKTNATFSQGKLTSKLFETISPLGFDVNIPINMLSKGLQICLNLGDITQFKVIEENNILISDVFKAQGLISGDENRVVVAGLDFQITEYIYRNLPDNSEYSKPLMINKDYKTLPEIDGPYTSEISKLFSGKNNSSAFSEKIMLDELSYPNTNKVIDPVIKDLIKRSKDYEPRNIPVFVNNLKNSNVISINIENTANPYLLALNIANQTASYNELVVAAQKEIDIKKYKSEGDEVRKLIDEVIQSLKNGSDLSDLSVDDIEEILFQRLLLKEDYARLKRFGKDFTSASEKQRKKNEVNEIKILAAVVYKFLQDKDTLITLHDAYGSGSDDFRRAALFRVMYEIGSINVKLKTLPYFNMSSIKNISNQLSLLISKKVVGIINPDNKALVNPSDYFDYFSGVYNIVGFRHVINEQEIYSEFKLVKRTMETL